MFSRVLVANRGEIALRIIRACRELDIETVVVHSEADRDALYLRLADFAVCIGPGPSVDSYLNIPRIISAAEIYDAQAIHPGCGFLAEDSHFAEVCEECNIRFIGPQPDVIKRMGDKAEAIRVAKKGKIPCIPGSDGVLNSEEEGIAAAKRIGYPVIVKAAAGGGGRGMRVAHNDMSLANAMFLCKREAEAAFGDPAIYMEKYIENARHIEVQVLGDNQGGLIHLGLRDCSLQRRHQKLIEESPPPGLNRKTRDDICKAAIKIARAVKYTNAGTVEFLLDRRGRFTFNEFNARLQVEHPVTEMVTGVDIVKEQLNIATGERLAFRQRDIRFHGVSIECRINAEDPDDDFRPCPGRITFYNPPGGPGVRLDTHICNGYEVPSHYDPLLAKLVVWGRTREEAIAATRRALDEFVIEGVKTTIPLYRAIFGHSRFVEGKVDTNFLDDFFASGS